LRPFTRCMKNHARARRIAAIAGGVLVVVIILIGSLATLVVLRPAYTPAIAGADAIAELDRIELGGVRQSILIRGRSTSNPILLFLHGGPGMPMMYLAYRFQRPLEDKFIVVQWDRRGAGKSYDPKIPISAMRVSQEMSDTRELVIYLRKRFHQQHVYLVAHSYGTYLGMLVVQRDPKLFTAYVGIGQLACSSDQTRTFQDAWLRREAAAAHNREALEQLSGNAPLDRERWLFEFGGEVQGMKSFIPLVMIGLRAPEYSFSDAMNVRKGVAFTHKYLRFDVISDKAGLMSAVPAVDVPVYFFTGRYDETDPHECTEKYFMRIKAPRKGLVWFDHSAHFPFLEENQKFVSELKKLAP
jgi:pimeloyl-ACP methyl ester carboxylesterase